LGSYVVGPSHTHLNGIFPGDAREMARAIPNDSVDLIYTDPPYDRASLDLYAWVARAGARVLKPGGFLLAMCGGSHLDEVFAAFGRSGLRFYWLYAAGMGGCRTGVCWPQGNMKSPVVVRAKQVLAYSKGAGASRTGTVDYIRTTGQDKRYHVWGQPEYSVRYYVDCFSAAGDLVWDPFCGGGTTPAMCKVLGRRWLAFDIDARAADVARERVREQMMPFWRPSVTQPELLLVGAE